MSASPPADPSVRVLPLEELDLRYRALRLPAHTSEQHALKASLERHGLQQPLLATDQVVPGRCVLLDGFKRVRALEESGVAQALTRVVSLDAPSALAALAALLATNSGRHGPSDLERRGSWSRSSATAG